VRAYWIERRRAALQEAAAIQKFLSGAIDEQTLRVELRRADVTRQQERETSPCVSAAATTVDRASSEAPAVLP
jgi:hypothetical protein